MKKILLILGAIFVSATANAATVKLGVDDAVDLIVAASQDLKKAELNVQKMEAVWDATSANRLPKITATGSYTFNPNIWGNPQTFDLPAQIFNPSAPAGVNVPFTMPNKIGMIGVDLTAPIYTFGKVGYALDAAKSAIKISQESLVLANREVRAAAVQLYYAAKVSEHIVEIAEKSLENTKKNQKALSAGGRANKGNLIKISADIAVKEASVSEAKFNRDSAMRMLKIYADLESSDTVVLTDDLPTKFSAAKMQELTEYPEWDILQAQLDSSKASGNAKFGQMLPTLAATASYQKIMAGTEWDIWNGLIDTNSASFGLALQIPIFDGMAANAQATQDYLDAKRVAEDLDKSKKQRKNDLINAIEQHNYLIENYKSQTKALDLAQKSYKMSSDRFRVGQASAVELADVESSLVQIQMGILNTRLQIVLAEETIRKLTGGDK